jgi:flavin-binding protein dodecin
MSHTYTMREVVGVSGDSFADATRRAVESQARTISGHSWFEVVELRGHVQEGRVTEYQAKIRVAIPDAG